MASSIFIEPNASDEIKVRDNRHSNLVVVYGKNGVNVDQNGLESLLENGNVSSVSVVRLSSPTPSMKEDNEKQNIIDDNSELLTTLQFSPKNEDEAEIVGLTVEEFYPSHEAKHLAKEILDYAGVVNPIQMKIDYDFQRYTVKNDHCYTPLISPSQKINPNDTSESSSISGINDSKLSDSSKTEDGSGKDNEDDEDNSDYTDFDLTNSDNDRDSDLDFSVNDRGKRKKAKKPARRYLPRITRKRLSEKDSFTLSEDEKKQNVFRSSKQNMDNRKMIAQSYTPKTVSLSKNSIKSSTQRLTPISVEKVPENIIKNVEKMEQLQTIKSTKMPTTKANPQKIIILKEEKIPALKFDQFKVDSSKTNEMVHNTTKIPITPRTNSYNTILQPISKGFMPLETAIKNQLPAQISLQTHTLCPILAPENDKQLDLINSIVKDEMKNIKKIVNEPMNENIPKIVKMLENTEKTIMANKKASNHLLSTIQATTTSGFRSTVEDFDITNAPLLETGNNDLGDDFLTATDLIESKTLDVVDVGDELNLNKTKYFDDQTNIDMIIKSDTQDILLSSDQCLESNELKTNKNEQPIQIIRGNGRVITLPPIEAPTTRAKRRAAQVTSKEIKTSTTSKINTDTTKITVDRNNAIRTKRQSSSTKNTATDNLSSESDEESDSEDDPFKLWCICRQPHNNRFMICCDKCQDWFHGTCVNITKAMGTEMEHNGIEWTCPRCIKATEVKKPIQRKITELFNKASETEKSNVKCGKINISSEKLNVVSDKLTTIHQQKALTIREKVISIKEKSMSTPSTTLMISAPSKTQEFKNTVQILRKNIPLIKKKTPEILKKVQTNLIKRNVGNNMEQLTQITPPLTIKTMSVVKKTNQQNDSSLLTCIVCKKYARENSIYCSDDCIRKHATNALLSKCSKDTAPKLITLEERKKKIPSTFAEALLKATENTLNIKNKIERVSVYERKSGRVLTGINAPTTIGLKRWLQENPTYEVVQTGSTQALAIDRFKQKLKTPSLNIILNKKEGEVEKPSKTIEYKIKTTDRLKEAQTLSTTASKPSKTIVYPVKAPPPEAKLQLITKIPKKQTVTENKMVHSSPQGNPAPTTNKEVESIRDNVKKTLKEQFISRMNETKDESIKKLSIEEIEIFANDTEYEMFILFNKDANAKYKAKYRSLMFNIKDRKNLTLFKKICEKKIQPRQLVRMSPEELASQELAQWRENENKHQLEMIKKSELDLLSCKKNYVLKTHKGEKIIEDKGVDRVSLDLATPVEDVVTILNSSAVTSTSETLNKLNIETIKNDSLDSTHMTEIDSTLETFESTVIRKEDAYKDRDDQKLTRKKYIREKHKRAHSKNKNHESQTGNEYTEIKKHKIETCERDKAEHGININNTISSKQTEMQLKHLNKNELFEEKGFNLIDKILESKTAEEATKSHREESKIMLHSSNKTVNKETYISADSDQEPSSTVTINTPPQDEYRKYSNEQNLWTGSINMVDVATFQIVVQQINGKLDFLRKELPKELDVVGRIDPDTVWDYIAKLKKSPNKEILVLRILPASETENNAYSALYNYLDKRNRLGVINTVYYTLKDFYILPLGANKKAPSVILTRDSRLEEDNRPDLLIGIIVRAITKKHSSSQHQTHIQSKFARKANDALLKKERFTPPNSPKNFTSGKNDSKIISSAHLPPKMSINIDFNAVPQTNSKMISAYASNDDDEPYSPGESSDEGFNSSSIVNQPAKPSVKETGTYDLNRKMEEINRQIEAREKEIAGMLQYESTTLPKTYDSTTSLPPTLANISIPSNLQQILASIKGPDSTKTSIQPPSLISAINDDSEEYIPEAATFSSPVYNYSGQSSSQGYSYIGNSKQAIDNINGSKLNCDTDKVTQNSSVKPSRKENDTSSFSSDTKYS